MGLPVESVTVPETFFTWAMEDNEIQVKKRRNVNLSRGLCPNGGRVCNIVAIVLGGYLASPNLLIKTDTAVISVFIYLRKRLCKIRKILIMNILWRLQMINKSAHIAPHSGYFLIFPKHPPGNI